VDGQPFSLLPPLYRPCITPEIGGNLLPGEELGTTALPVDGPVRVTGRRIQDSEFPLLRRDASEINRRSLVSVLFS
jgi:hypothetical protein